VVTQWANSISEKDSSAIGYELLPLWVVIKKSNDKRIASRGRDIQTAFAYISGLKQYRTRCTLTVYFKPGTNGQAVDFTIPLLVSGAQSIGLLLDPNYKHSQVSISGRDGPRISVTGPYLDGSTPGTVKIP
jgi:hypothetical protein